MKQTAVWGMEYDFRNDKCYDSPMHKECDAPVIFSEGYYRCISCGQEVEVDDKMKRWFDERAGSKEEVRACLNCGEKTMTYVYYKNKCTLEWQVAHGKCSNCGSRFIV